MRRISEQHDALSSPHRQWVAEVERRDQRGCHSVDQPQHVRCRTGEGPPQVFEVTGGSPLLAEDLSGRHEPIERLQVSADRKRHGVTVWPEPRDERMRLESGRHVGGWDCPPPRGKAREACRLLAEQDRSYRGAQPVRANHDVPNDLLAALELSHHAVGTLFESYETRADSDPLRWDAHREALEQIGPMHADHVNAAKALRPRRIRLAEDCLAAVHSPQLARVYSHARPEDVVGRPKALQHADPVRLDADAGSDLAEPRRLLEDQRLETRLLQRDRGREAGNSAADHQDAHRRPLTAVSRPAARLRTSLRHRRSSM